MSDHDRSQANITFGADNNFQHALIRLEHVAGRDIILNHDPHDVTLLRDLNPYLGLKSFTYADHASYAGRDTLVAATVTQLTTPGAEQAFVLVTGASGSGKSSFVQAGVVPRLIEQYRHHRIGVAWEILRPSLHPMAALTAALRGLGVTIPLGEVVTPDTWHMLLRTRLTPNQIVCLVIDQLEEVFGAEVATDQRSDFFALLTTLPAFAVCPIHIIATLRSDFLPELFSTPLYASSKMGIDLQAMTSRELHQAIERPTTQLLREIERRLPELAQRMGPKQWNRAVLERLSTDAAQDASYLPLLQVTLQDMWRNGQLKLESYSTLTAAIQERAETVWRWRDYDGTRQTQRTDAEQTALMALLLDLVDVSLDADSRRDVRRSSRMADLTATDPDRHRLIDDLVRARLVSTASVDDGVGRTEWVDIIHESLLRNWSRLTRAIQDQRTTLQRRARFRDDLAQWQTSEQVLEGVRLAAALDLVQHGDTVTQSEPARALIQHSVAARDADQAARTAEREERLRQAEAAAETQRRLSQRTRRFAMVVVVLLVVVLGAAGFAFKSQAEALAQKDIAETNARISESQRLVTEARNQPDLSAERGLLLSYEALQNNDNPNSNATLRAFLDRVVWEVIPLSGHTGAVESAVFSPDGTRILTASDDGTARLWRSDGSLITTLTGHTAAVLSAVFSPDGTQILTASADQTARLWRSDGSPITTLTGHTDIVSSAVFSPDGTQILTASADQTARLWHRDGTPIATLAGHTAVVYSAVFSPDGSQILTASLDQTARVWRSDGSPVSALTGHTDAVISAAFSPDGTRIVTASLDQTARLWHRDGRPISTLAGHSAVVWSAVFSPDGAQIVTTSSDQTARLWHRDGTPIATLTGHMDAVSSAVFSPDGSQIVTASRDGTARLWRRDGTPIATLAGHMDAVSSAVFSSDGSQIVTTSSDQTARLWRRDDTPIAMLTGHTGEVESAAFSPDGTQIVTVADYGTVRLWRSDGSLITTLTDQTLQFHSPVFSPDGSQIVTTSSDQTARLWRSDGTPITTLTGHTGAVGSPVFSLDGTRILTASDDGTARLWRSDGTPMATLTGHTAVVWSAVFSPDGTQVVTASDDGTARLWRSDGTPMATLTGHTAAVVSAAFSSDGRQVVTASADGTARLWRSDGSPITTLTGHTDVVLSAAFSPDGTQVVAAFGDGNVRLWRSDGSLIATLTGYITSAAFSPDGRQLVTTSQDGTARLWRSDGSLITTLMGHTKRVSSAVFSSNGSQLVTASADGTARIYLVHSEDLLKVAACRVGRGLTEAEKVQFAIPSPTFVFAERHCPPKLSWQQ